ncbi:collagen alpha-1(XIV) chain-like [Actinia tenebrosa]|uniref:Collagen alpha-1(XIV) chain-like n=1 Tax=Actinia tenebrosa TaxID=6105 RepID=A0A6P8IAV8_ACTTE|nr:collagen alpha-1(XIV) chain-like [Actinia tenebrosa]
MVRLFVAFIALCLINDAFPAPAKHEDLCSAGMDIAFILDARLSSSTWKKTLRMSKKIVDEFGASEDGNHFAVMTFNTEPQIDMKFNKYNGSDLSREKINGDIDGLKRKTGYKFIDRALLAAEKEVFTVEAGMRQKARKVAVVITDGIQTKNRGQFLNLYEASNGLKSKDVEIYSIGVGEDIDVLGLLDMASSEDKVITSGWYILSEFGEFKNSFCYPIQ